MPISIEKPINVTLIKIVKADAIIFLPWNINSFLKKKFLSKFNVDYISLEDIVKNYNDKNQKTKN